MKLQSLSEHFSDDSVLTHRRAHTHAALLSFRQQARTWFCLCCFASSGASRISSFSLYFFVFKRKPILCSWNRKQGCEFSPLNHGAAQTFFLCQILFLFLIFLFFNIKLHIDYFVPVCKALSFHLRALTFSCFVSVWLPSLCPSNLALLFCQRALSTDSFALCDCFVFSVRGQCVYLAQILNLFITMADLGGAQTSSAQGGCVLTGP